MIGVRSKRESAREVLVWIAKEHVDAYEAWFVNPEPDRGPACVVTVAILRALIRELEAVSQSPGLPLATGKEAGS